MQSFLPPSSFLSNPPFLPLLPPPSSSISLQPHPSSPHLVHEAGEVAHVVDELEELRDVVRDGRAVRLQLFQVVLKQRAHAWGDPGWGRGMAREGNEEGVGRRGP